MSDEDNKIDLSVQHDLVDPDLQTWEEVSLAMHIPLTPGWRNMLEQITQFFANTTPLPVEGASDRAQAYFMEDARLQQAPSGADRFPPQQHWYIIGYDKQGTAHVRVTSSYVNEFSVRGDTVVADEIHFVREPAANHFRLEQYSSGSLVYRTICPPEENALLVGTLHRVVQEGGSNIRVRHILPSSPSRR